MAAEGAAAQARAFAETAALGVPVSTVLSVGALGGGQGAGALADLLDELVSVAERLAAAGAPAEQLQRALLDVVEFLVAREEALCTRDREVLPRLRKQVTRFEDLLNNVRLKIDYRAFSMFMENKLGDVVLSINGPICSPFNKIKSKLFRASLMTWEERERVIESLLSNVSDKRRGFLVEGRAEVRGYRDMSDQELKAWVTLASELTTADDDHNNNGAF